jgi:hypothetical protein
MFGLVSRTLSPMFELYKASPVFITGARMLSYFIDPREDIGFKRLFQNPIAVKSFLNSLMESKKITEVTLDPNEQTSQYILPRTFIDIYCKTDNGETFIVEMKRLHSRYLDNQNYILQIQLYGSEVILAQHKSKRFGFDSSKKRIDFQYKDLSKVYVVAILAPSKSGERYTEDYFFQDQDPIKHFKFCNSKFLEKNVDVDSIVEKTIPHSLLHFTFVELRKIHHANIENSVLKEWLGVVICLEKMYCCYIVVVLT